MNKKERAVAKEMRATERRLLARLRRAAVRYTVAKGTDEHDDVLVPGSSLIDKLTDLQSAAEAYSNGIDVNTRMRYL